MTSSRLIRRLVLLTVTATFAGCFSPRKANQGDSGPACTPGLKRCVGKEVDRCRDNGSGWDHYRTCGASEVCSNGQCETPPATCGNTTCDANETCNNCPADCGQCCGNGECESVYSETPQTCPADCKPDGGPSSDARVDGPRADAKADALVSDHFVWPDQPQPDGKPLPDTKLWPDMKKWPDSKPSADTKLWPDVLKPDSVKPSVCGDGSITGSEVCDGANLASKACLSFGYVGGTLKCASDCKSFDLSSCHHCGNGNIEGGEACDGATLGGKSCTSIGLGFSGGSLACSASCALNTSGCYKCGDGAINPGEQCDVGQLGGATCLSLGYTGGNLACKANCTYDPAGCTSACGFNSQFTSDAVGWSAVYGSWSVSGGNYTTTNGPAQAYHSAAYGQTYSNFTFEAKMRSSGQEPLKHHGIWLRGVASATGYANNWPSGYLFSILYGGGSGQFAVQIMVGSGYVVPWTSTTAVVNANWNVLKVVAQGSSLTFFVNGTQVASVTDTLYSTGSVGVMIAGNNYGGISNLEVDYATLSCLPPTATCSSALSEDFSAGISAWSPHSLYFLNNDVGQRPLPSVVSGEYLFPSTVAGGGGHYKALSSAINGQAFEIRAKMRGNAGAAGQTAVGLFANANRDTCGGGTATCGHGYLCQWYPSDKRLAVFVVDGNTFQQVARADVATASADSNWHNVVCAHKQNGSWELTLDGAVQTLSINTADTRFPSFSHVSTFIDGDSTLRALDDVSIWNCN